MTLSKLIRELQKLEKAGRGRAKVAVNKRTLNDGNDTWNVCDVHSAVFEYVNNVDGDGFTIENKDGSERMTATVILRGEWFDS